jgi:WD40 repeat protein
MRFVTLVVLAELAIGVSWPASADERFKVVRTFESTDFPGGLEFAVVLPEQNVVLATQWAPERSAFIAWEMMTGKTRFMMPMKTPAQSPALFYKLDFSSPPDAAWFALPQQRFENPSDVSLVAISDGRIIRQFADSQTGSSTGLVVFDNGRSVIGGCLKGKVRIWDTGTGKLKHTLDAHDKSVYAIAIDETAGLLATHSVDSKLSIWDLRTRRPMHSADLMSEGARALAVELVFADHGKSLIGTLAQSGQKAGTVIIDVESLAVRKTVKATTLVHRQTVDASGRLAVFGVISKKVEKRVRVIQLGKSERIMDLSPVPRPVTSVAIAPDCKLIAAQSFSNFDVKGRDIETANAEVDQGAKEIMCRVDFFFGSQFRETVTLSLPCKDIDESVVRGQERYHFRGENGAISRVAG